MNKDLRSYMPDSISSKLIKKRYSSGTPILLAGYDNHYVFFLQDGYAEAYIQNSQGTVATIHAYKPNSIFGEIEPFCNELKPVSITTVTPCVVEMLHHEYFIEWLKNDFTAVSILLGILADKLVSNSLLIEEISLMNVQERVLRRIAVYKYSNRLNSLTKQQLSLEANAPIRSVNRAIAKSARDGLFTYQNHQFEVLNEHAIMNFLPEALK
jgi:probable cAMP-binding regulatory protein